MKLLIYGAGAKGVQLKNIIEKHLKDTHEVQGFVENRVFSKLGKLLENKPIYSIYQLKKLYENNEIDGICIPTSYHRQDVREMIRFSKEMGLPETDIYMTSINILRKEPLEKEDVSEIVVPLPDFIQIFDLNVHVIDKCNLNCSSCSHFSNLTDSDRAVPLDVFHSDLKRLSKLVKNIYQLTILGGEPLLCKNLEEYLDIARKYYPYTKLQLVTNGLLLQQVEQPLINAIARNRVVVSVSLYPVMADKAEQLVAFLESNQLLYEMHPVYEFDRRWSLEPVFNAAEMNKNCGCCMGMTEGKISRCIMALYVKYFNEKFGQSLPENCWIDLYEEELTGKDLMRELEKPLDLCAHCSEGLKLERHPWECGEKSIDKFLVVYEKELQKGIRI